MKAKERAKQFEMCNMPDWAMHEEFVPEMTKAILAAEREAERATIERCADFCGCYFSDYIAEKIRALPSAYGEEEA